MTQVKHAVAPGWQLVAHKSVTCFKSVTGKGAGSNASPSNSMLHESVRHTARQGPAAHSPTSHSCTVLILQWSTTVQLPLHPKVPSTSQAQYAVHLILLAMPQHVNVYLQQTGCRQGTVNGQLDCDWSGCFSATPDSAAASSPGLFTTSTCPASDPASAPTRPPAAWPISAPATAPTGPPMTAPAAAPVAAPAHAAAANTSSAGHQLCRGPSPTRLVPVSCVWAGVLAHCTCSAPLQLRIKDSGSSLPCLVLADGPVVLHGLL